MDNGTRDRLIRNICEQKRKGNEVSFSEDDNHSYISWKLEDMGTINIKLGHDDYNYIQQKTLTKNEDILYSRIIIQLTSNLSEGEFRKQLIHLIQCESRRTQIYTNDRHMCAFNIHPSTVLDVLEHYPKG